VFLTEEELPVEVRGFDVIGISHDNATALTTTYFKHCKVFEELTPDSTRTDHENPTVLQPAEEVRPYYSPKTFCAVGD
jgi:hypothetical protein